MGLGTGDHGYFREVYRSLLDHAEHLDERRGFLDGVTGAVAARLSELAPLRRRERLPARGHHTVGDEQLWRSWEMYALSRISDYLLEKACPQGWMPPGFGAAGGRRFDPPASTARSDFLAGIELAPFEHGGSFSPFHHEIFAVVTDFNWDGDTDIGADVPVSPDGSLNPDAERSLQRRRELLLHRCFVRAPLPSDEDDWYPFGTRISISATAWPLPDDAITHPSWSS